MKLINLLYDTGPAEVRLDEFPRNGCTIEALSRLRPAFVQDGNGTVTAGNSSGEFSTCTDRCTV